MFLNKKYILANELIEKMGIKIANISIFYKSVKHLSSCPIIKMNSLSFINTKSNSLPANMSRAIQEYEFTDLSDKMPCNYMTSYYGVSRKELENANLIIKTISISGKKFYQFRPEYVLKLKNKIVYILSEEETNACYSKNLIDGYVKLKKNKFLCWY